jgi:DNA repair exonuclease SbcCD nuclease subunit
MPSDILFTTDEHFMSSNGNKNIFESQMEFFENQLFPYILENKIKYWISLGDFNDDRSRIDAYIHQELKQRFFRWIEDHQIQFHVLVGNHSTVFKNTLSHHYFKENVNEFKYIRYYDEISVLEIDPYIFVMVPWITGSMTDVKLPTGDICCLHGEIKGFNKVKGCECTDGIELSFFKSFQKILSGHFHNYQEKENCMYIGNPYQKDFNDFGEQKGFWTLDDSYSFTFHENTICPKFVKIVYSDNKIEVIGD